MRCALVFIMSVILALCTGCENNWCMDPFVLDKSELVFSAKEESQEVVSLTYASTIDYLYLTDSDYNKIEKCKLIINDDKEVLEAKGAWLSVRVQCDGGNISVTVDENDTGNTRYALLRLKCGPNVGGKVKIVQKAK